MGHMGANVNSCARCFESKQDTLMPGIHGYYWKQSYPARIPKTLIKTAYKLTYVVHKDPCRIYFNTGS